MNIFITGGSSGLGLSLSKEFINDGHVVGTCSFESFESIKNILPDNIIYYQADVTDNSRMKEIIEDFFNKTGKLDIVIANAGISMPKAKIPDFEKGRKVIMVNIIGVLNTFEPAINIMKEQKFGQIVSLGSIAGRVGLPGTAIYGASKSAVLNLCESLEIDLAYFGIHVTTLAPGFISTPLVKNNKHKMPFLMSEEKAVSMIKKAILNRKNLYVFPLPMNIISTILYHLPRTFYKFFMKSDLLGLSKNNYD